MQGFDLSQRHFQPELMDRPELDVHQHHRALTGLRRLNRASGVCRQLWRHIATLPQCQRGGLVRLLDVASGGGDVAWGLYHLARRHGVKLKILGLDVSAAACQYASTRCTTAGDAIAFEQADVTREALPTGFDAVTCSLFLHHLPSDQATQLLANMAAAGELLLASDLRRCVEGYALAHAAARVITRSAVVRYDAPQSVANSFSLDEMQALCTAAGLTGASVRKAWPCRLSVVHRRN